MPPSPDALQDHSGWYVLLIGGPSGIGKTTIAAQVARRLNVSWLMVDDLRLALMRSGLPIPESDHVMDPAAPGGLIDVAHAVSPAIEVVIENHVDQRYPMVIEGDGILPSLFERESVRLRSSGGRVRAVFLHEPDEDALYENLVTRNRDTWRPDLRAYARKSAHYGAWLKREAEQRALPVIPVRPWETVVPRILKAAGLESEGGDTRGV